MVEEERYGNSAEEGTARSVDPVPDRRGPARGPYTAIEKTYTALTAFVAAKGVTPESFQYEEYLNSPEDTSPDKLETNFYFPLKG